MPIVTNPRDLGVPHSFWRPNQFQAYRRIATLHANGGGITFQELPTGSGKTAIATALGSTEKVLALVQNHGLLDQYERAYGFNIVKGRQEYPCVLESKVDTWKRSYNITPTAADCHFKDPSNCPMYDSCPYIVARNTAIQSDRMACTYKYASVSDAVKARKGILVMDEAHVAVEEILGLSSFTMDENTRDAFKFPDFPLQEYGTNSEGDLLTQEARITLLGWVMSCLSIVGTVDLFDRMTPNGAKTVRIFEQLTGLFNLIAGPDDLFYKCTSKSSQDNDWRTFYKSNLMTLTIRTLNAGAMARQLFGNKQTVLLMSATIGNPSALASELEITHYTYNTYPHPITPEYRPVYRLDVPRMTKTNIDANPSLYKIQAQTIGKFIKCLDHDWRGIVLTTSNYKVGLLRRFLGEVIPGRIFSPVLQNNGVSQRVSAFIENKTPGMVAVDTIQGWGTGIDLRGDIARFAIVAGVPFSNPGDRFDAIRMSTDSGRRYSIWLAHSATQQACGRVVRGEKDENANYILNVAALADGSCLTQQAMSQYSPWFKEAIHEYADGPVSNH